MNDRKLAPRSKRRRKHACVHEAGHCLAMWYFGYRIDRVTVLTTAETRAGTPIVDRNGRPGFGEGMIAGSDIVSPGLTRALAIPSFDAEQVRLMEISAQIALTFLYAGVVAEARYRKWSIVACMRDGGRSDAEKAERILDDWFSHEAPFERDRISELAFDRAGCLIRSTQGWRAAIALADTLMQRGQLDGEEVSEICRTAYGDRQPDRACWHRHWPPTREEISAGYIPARMAALMNALSA